MIELRHLKKACFRFPRRRRGKALKINLLDRNCPVICELAAF